MAGKIITWTAEIKTRREDTGGDFCTVNIDRNGWDHGEVFTTKIPVGTDIDSMFNAAAAIIDTAENFVASKGFRVVRPRQWNPDVRLQFHTLLAPAHDHYTVYLNTSMAGLDAETPGSYMDLSILADEPEDVWTTDEDDTARTWVRTPIDVLTATTKVHVNGDVTEGKMQALRILEDAGWSLASPWTAFEAQAPHGLQTGFWATVEKR